MATSISKLLSPNFFLILICLFFLLTRLYKINEIPPSLYWDEASIGYNAYSISQTGKDEWGEFLPIHFRAFGEFKLPVYIYTTAIFIKLFGLNEFSIRLPAVLFSLMTVLITYLLAKELFRDTKLALFSAFFLTCSSWLFIFSRAGYEVSAGLMFFILGVYFMILAIKKKYLIIFATLSLILSIYSYNSFRILAPIALILLLFLHIQPIKIKNYFLILSALIIFIISLTPIVRLLIYDAGFGRVQAFTLLPTIQQVYDLSGKPHLQLIFDRSKSTDWNKNFTNILTNYFVHFSPSFLLLEGDSNSRNHPQGFGQLFLTDIFLALLGIFIIKKQRKLLLYLPIIFLFLGPIPAILFKEAPHALRSLTVVPFLSILMAVGATSISKHFKKAPFLIIFIYLLFFVYFFQNFISQYNRESSQDWQYGYKGLFLDYKDQFNKFDKIIISDEYAQPYIFALYYLRYHPEKFRNEVKYNPVNNRGFSAVSKFDKFEFRKINKEDLKAKKTLIFATNLDKLDNISPYAEIKFLDEKTAFWVYNEN
ncbi:MAG: Uncharacterized protein G01um10147_58 [Microgenomates group bacterium Gr01-1014_7]|nr:MAG: Uncharacterized protein G01um10147_58 [Microgenomates group bacterium Gr01-1014_7]